MPSTGNINTKAILDPSAYLAELNRMGGATVAFKNMIEGISFTRFHTSMYASATIMYGISTMISKMSQGIEEYSNLLAKLGSVADLTSSSIDSLADSMKQLSMQRGLSRKDIMTGMYTAVQSGFTNPEDMSEIALSSAKLARSSGREITVDKSANLISTLRQSLGISNEDVKSGALNSLLLRGRDVGKWELRDMAEALGKVTTIYGNQFSGVLDPMETLRQIVSMMSSATLVGLPLNTVSTGVRRIAERTFQLSDSNSKGNYLREQMRKLGYNSDNPIMESFKKGPISYLHDILKASNGSTAEIYKMGFQSREIQAVSSILRSNGSNLDRIYNLVSPGNVAGTENRYLNRMQNSYATARDMLRSRWEITSQEFMRVSVPFIESFIKVLTRLNEIAIRLPDSAKAFMMFAASMTAIIQAAKFLGLGRGGASSQIFMNMGKKLSKDIFETTDVNFGRHMGVIGANALGPVMDYISSSRNQNIPKQFINLPINLPILYDSRGNQNEWMTSGLMTNILSSRRVMANRNLFAQAAQYEQIKNILRTKYGTTKENIKDFMFGYNYNQSIAGFGKMNPFTQTRDSLDVKGGGISAAAMKYAPLLNGLAFTGRALMAFTKAILSTIGPIAAFTGMMSLLSSFIKGWGYGRDGDKVLRDSNGNKYMDVGRGRRDFFVDTWNMIKSGVSWFSSDVSGGDTEKLMKDDFEAQNRIRDLGLNGGIFGFRNATAKDAALRAFNGVSEETRQNLIKGGFFTQEKDGRKIITTPTSKAYKAFGDYYKKINDGVSFGRNGGTEEDINKFILSKEGNFTRTVDMLTDAMNKAVDSTEIYAKKMQEIAIEETNDFYKKNSTSLSLLKNLSLYPIAQRIMNDFSDYTYSENSRSFTNSKKFSVYARKAYGDTYLPYIGDSIEMGDNSSIARNDLQSIIKDFEDNISGTAKGGKTVYRKKINKYYENALSALNRTTGAKALFNWGMNKNRTTEDARQLLNSFSNNQFNNIGSNEQKYLLGRMMNFDLSKFMTFDKIPTAPFSDSKLYGSETGYNATLVRPEADYTAKLQIEKLSSIIDEFSSMDSTVKELQSSFDSFIEELKNAMGNPEENAKLDAEEMSKTFKNDTIPNSLIPRFDTMLKGIMTTQSGWPEDTAKA